MSVLPLILLVAAAHADPEADIGGPYIVTAGSTETLDASASDTSDCTRAWFAWDLDGDGTFEVAYKTADTATFDASDLDGPTAAPIAMALKCQVSGGGAGTSVEVDEDEDEIEVENADPQITSVTIPVGLEEGGSGTFSVAFTDPEAADTHSIAWTLSDGRTATGTNAYFSFDNDIPGLTVQVVVTDDDGGEAIEERDVDVANLSPTIAGTPDPTVRVLDVWEFTPSGTDPGDDALTWSLEGQPDGMHFSENTGSMVWPTSQFDVGGWPMTLTLTDDGGDKDTLHFDVQVLESTDTGGEEPGDGGSSQDGGAPVDDTGDTSQDTSRGPTTGDPQTLDAFGDTGSGPTVGCSCSQSRRRVADLGWVALLGSLIGARRRRSV